MLFLAGFIPSKGALRDEIQGDSLPIRRAVELSTDGQKRVYIYNDLKGGDSLYRLAIREDSTYAPAYFAISQLFSAQRGSTDSVALYAKKAYELDTLNKWYSDGYAQALALSGKYVDARHLYEKAIEREPQNVNGYIMVAMLYRQTNEPHAALAVLDSAEMRTGKSSYISSFRRELLLATGQREEAIEEAIEMTIIEPQELQNRLILAELYISTKQDSLALKEYHEALKIDSTSTIVIGSIAQFHVERSNFPAYFAAVKLLFRSEQESLDNKVALFNRITSDRNFYSKNFYSINELATQLYLSYPTEQSVVELFAKHLIASGSLDAALELYKKHAAQSPPNYDYYSQIIDIESYRQRADSVELYSKRAIELFPDRHELRLAQANFYSYTQRYNDAIKEYREVLSFEMSDSLKSSIWGSIGDNYHQLHLLEEPGSRKAKKIMNQAYSAYDKALELDRENALVLNNYAYFLSLEQRDLGTALDMSGRAIALVEGNPTYLDTYAWILFELERYEEAKKIMRQVIALDTSNSADIQFHYAEILAALGEEFMAEVYYDKALKLGFDADIIQQRKEKLK